MTPDEREAWVMRIFGNWDAYYASLPDGLWVQSLHGWYLVSN